MLFLLLILSYFAISLAKTTPTTFPFSTIINHQKGFSSGYSTKTTDDNNNQLYDTKYFTQIVDHFTFTPQSYHTFQQRYLINDTYWGGAKKMAPIFVYMGGEADIELSAQNTGFMFDYAPNFNALLVFIEHRFYGKSFPGGDEEVKPNSTTLGYLSSTQALADYATLIIDLKKNLTATDSPVVVFGGSYPGMLAAWFRLKYPHVTIGALASSAPILYFDNITSPYAFNDIITQDFRISRRPSSSKKLPRLAVASAPATPSLAVASAPPSPTVLRRRLVASAVLPSLAVASAPPSPSVLRRRFCTGDTQPRRRFCTAVTHRPPSSARRFCPAAAQSESENCYKVIKSSWQLIQETAKQAGGLESLMKSFRICDTARNYISVDSLEEWLTTAYIYTAMTDYPTAANFLNPLPPYPIKQMCKAIDDPRHGNDQLEKLYAAVNIFYNYTGELSCFDMRIPHALLSIRWWTWQVCTEMIMPIDGNNNDSIFPTSEWNYTERVQFCKDIYSIEPRPNWITTEFGGHNIERVLESFGSNIIFFNGLRDPWSAGGVLKTISKSLVTIIAKEGAHHVDLRSSTSEDPEWLKDVRKEEGVRKMDIKRPDAKCKYLGVEPSIGYLLPNPKKHHMLGNNSRQ
nr:lysosomal Pro-X carboxypeptidase-like [Ipomoea batatas]